MTTADRIDDLTDEQVAALTDDDVDLLIKRRMAEEGIPVLPMPIEPEYLPVPGPEVPFYEVAGVGFTDRTAADEVLAVIHRHDQHRAQPDYDYGVSGYETRYLKSDATAQSVTTRMYYSQETYKRHAETLAANKAAREQYQAAKREWDAAQNQAGAIRDEVHGRIADVAERARHRAFLADRYAEYVAIANGDELMAMQFLVKAFDPSDEDISYLRNAQAVAS